MAIIEISGLSKRYSNGLVALSSVSLSCEAGAFVVVLGPSGAGKSTLLRCINGLEQPSAGAVRVGERVVARHTLRQVRTEAAMIFQHFNLVGRLGVLTNVLLGRLAHQSRLSALAGVLYLFRQRDIAVAHTALARVGLVEKAWERADRLSGGQQQRVAIARALAQAPRVLLADEPVASLDPVTGLEIMELLHAICRADGITLLVNLHQVELARRFADRIIGLNSGRVVFDGPPAALSAAALETIYERPRTTGQGTAASYAAA